MDEDTTGISRVGIIEASMLPLIQEKGMILLLSGIALKRGRPVYGKGNASYQNICYLPSWMVGMTLNLL